LSRAIPAGVVDAGLASLATFILNLYAITKWESADPKILGIYFLYVTAFIMASTVPTQLLFVPAEKVTLDVPRPARIALFGVIARLGLPVATAAAGLIGLATLVGFSKGVSWADQAPFLISAAIATLFSPLQNHARRLLHLAAHSWAAAAVSLVQVGTAAVTLFLLLQTSIAAQWIPIGSLAVANVVSVGVAVAIMYRFGRAVDPKSRQIVEQAKGRIGHRELAPSGRWLVGTGIVSSGNNFLVESAISLLAGLPALALAGSAKTVAQPILVLANGLRSVLGPPSMEAAKDRNRRAARRVTRTFVLLMAGAVIGYVAIAGFDWIGNPLAALVNAAYTVPLLVVLTIAANGLNGAAFPGRMELIGAGKERNLFRVELQANIAQLGVAVIAAAAAGSSTSAGSFARPVAFAVLGATRIGGYGKALNVHYDESPVLPDTAASLPPPEDTTQ
jgi:O-antigen/teichoic acid export membrane protein